MINKLSILPKIEEEVKHIIAAYPDHFLVEIRLLPKNKLQVIADADTGITINTCAAINRALQKTLEQEKWLGDDYEIEVSSPGIDSPLKVLRQYKRRIGKEMEIQLNNGSKHCGILLEANDQQIKLGIKKNGKKTHELETEHLIIPFTHIKYAKLILKF